MKISIIIPIYKAEFFIRECLDNLLSQSYDNIELILVDDGSPDNSGKIADEYSQKDNRVTTIHKQNGGASDARNNGVSIAKGDYLLFVDADDFLKSKASINKLVEQLKINKYPEILGFNIEYYFPSKNKYVKWIPYNEDITLTKEKDKLIKELIKTGTFPVSPCGKLIKREPYIKSGIQFKVGTIGEDIPWTIELFDKLANIVYVNEYHYCYRQEVSTSVTSDFNEKKYLDMLDITRELPELINSTRFNNETKNSLLSFAAYELSIIMAELSKLSKGRRTIVINQLKQMTYLFDYRDNPKVRMVSKIYSILGFKLTSYALSLYLKVGARNKRI